jgi:hypothetical protein
LAIRVRDPSLLAEDLAAAGLVLIEDLNGTDAKRRYQRDDLFPVAPSDIVHATVCKRSIADV